MLSSVQFGLNLQLWNKNTVSLSTNVKQEEELEFRTQVWM